MAPIYVAKLIFFSQFFPPSCLLQDTPDYVAYVAKDPVNQRGNTLSSESTQSDQSTSESGIIFGTKTLSVLMDLLTIFSS